MPVWSSSSVSFSSSVSWNGKTESQRYAKQTQRTPEGTTIKSASQRSGEPVYTETLEYDSHGRPIVEGRVLRGGPQQAGRIEDVSDRK
ncbi:cytochrome p450 [Colletotrichum truncatum]|uniref:Cytochrome p450 n=1 Tax=Colletotrichum truncatum TaxID=5467 RepID=A0ACC3Z267_COLTU|nr:cytochrome p450 [Colletotrichum truncatum]KAF6781670.1 cytochrome p450 [Colletotrichum truncatum]